MPNISVYVNEDLKGRMELEEGENWSKVAAAAFEKRLADLIDRKKVDDMTAAIQRLRASRNEYKEAINMDSFRVGKRWAAEAASFVQLKRLSELSSRLDGVSPIAWIDFFDDSNESNPAPAVTFACEVEGLGEIDWDAARDFWANVIELQGGRLPDSDFVHGFAEGALEFYDAISDKL